MKKINLFSLVLVISLVLNSCGGDSVSLKREYNSTDVGDNGIDENISASYQYLQDTLIESRSDGSKRAWINTTSEACKVLRKGDLLQKAKVYCRALSQEAYAAITNWRVPTPFEAGFLMRNHIGSDKLKYPASNPGCLFMMTNQKDIYVYTSNYALEDIGKRFTDTARLAAGIRCVADQ